MFLLIRQHVQKRYTVLKIGATMKITVLKKAVNTIFLTLVTPYAIWFGKQCHVQQLTSLARVGVELLRATLHEKTLKSGDDHSQLAGPNSR